jgi:hypothetical protein
MQGAGMSDDDAALYRQHVVPLHDLREHEPTLACWCGPVVDADGVVTHHPIDPQAAALQGDDGARS